MNYFIVFFAVIIPGALATYGLGKGTVTKINSRAVAGMENENSCHIRRVWRHAFERYRMYCFQCEDDDRQVIIYNNAVPVDSAFVLTCNHDKVAASITIVNSNGGDHADIIEYEFTNKACVRVHYHRDKNEMWKLDNDCSKTTHFRGLMIAGYQNGWLEEVEGEFHGYVKQVIVAHRNIDQDCVKMGTWDHLTKPITMKCMRCGVDMVAVIYHTEYPMAAAKVGTCRTGYLEHSIDFVEPRSRHDQPHEFQVQYNTENNKCISYFYRRADDMKRQGSAALFYGSKGECTSVSWFRTSRVRGYHNNWKLRKNKKRFLH